MTPRILLCCICIYVAAGFSHCESKDDCHTEEDAAAVQVEINPMGEVSGSNMTIKEILTSLAKAHLSARHHRRGLTLATKSLARMLPRSLHKGSSQEELEAAREKIKNVLLPLYPAGVVQIAEAAKPRALRRMKGNSEPNVTESDGVELLDATKLSLVTYHTDDEGFSPKESPWPMISHYIVKGEYSSRDMVTLHEKDGRCVVTFEGSDDLMDFINNFKFTHQVVACGGKILNGFWDELKPILASPHWEEKFIPILTSAKCTSIYAAGHSLGGALAEIFAACANHGQLHRLAKSAKTPLTIDKVYSTGAPAISTVPISNPKSEDGCFGGYRAFISDRWHYDVVAACTGLVHYLHPDIKPMAIQDSMSNGNYSKETWGCKGHEALWEPSKLTDDVKVGPLDIPLPKLPDIDVHMPDAYIERLKYIYNQEQ
mmetsp:Transcript_6732/g.16424  ORF Transcript_6732/g.16424 Transcript_6732/m.16424 type:complete len:429 (-) Transcript_6732:81-1367(-)